MRRLRGDEDELDVAAAPRLELELYAERADEPRVPLAAVGEAEQLLDRGRVVVVRRVVDAARDQFAAEQPQFLGEGGENARTPLTGGDQRDAARAAVGDHAPRDLPRFVFRRERELEETGGRSAAFRQEIESQHRHAAVGDRRCCADFVLGQRADDELRAVVKRTQ